MNGAKRFLLRAYLAMADVAGRLALRSEAAFRMVMKPGHEGMRWNLGVWRAWQAFEDARRAVPAYRRFASEKGAPAEVPFDGWLPDLSGVPVTDKDNYVRKYRLEERCKGGAFPPAGVMVDESSGTSGKANNWVRGRDEREAVGRTLQIAMRHRFGHEPIFVVNAFALGPWATGMNVSMSVVDISILKSTGPDLKKIENTLLDFGTGYRYIVMGYPPFLKALADLDTVDWAKYDVTAIFGGEGMSESMRTYLLRRFRNVYGSYGASDLEINIAAETDFSIAVRRRLESDAALRERLLAGPKGVLPMVFQYNPMDYFVETNADGELVVTVARLNSVSPKIRYNIHDLGHVLRIPDYLDHLRKAGISDPVLAQPPSELPLLFHYGRADQSVAYYGCKVTPASVEEIVFGMPGLAEAAESFALLVSEDERANKRLAVAIELRADAAVALTPAEIAGRLFAALQAANQDFRESIRMVPAGLEPTVELHPHGTGPFAGHDVRLKRSYIRKS